MSILLHNWRITTPNFGQNFLCTLPLLIDLPHYLNFVTQLHLISDLVVPPFMIQK